MKTLIKNGRIVTAVDDYRADILIENKITTALDAGFNFSEARGKKVGR